MVARRTTAPVTLAAPPEQFFLRLPPLEFAAQLDRYAAMHPGWMFANLMYEAAATIRQLVEEKDNGPDHERVQRRSVSRRT